MTTLYKTNKNYSIQQWSIEVSGPTFTCIYGQVGGKLQSQQTICKSVNIGKSNETTPEQQAQLEASALIAKKIKSGYSYDQSGPTTVQLPQKVKCYQDQLKNVIFPCYSTPKLNGVNATYWLLPNGKLHLTSRGGETYPAIPHLESYVLTLMNHLGTIALNGELYIHDEHLQDIQSAVKKPNQLTPLLEFNIFEMPLMTCAYSAKNKIMWDTINDLCNWFEDKNNLVSFITGIECHSNEDIEVHYNQCMQAKLEGTVIYNANAVYQFNTRSSNVFKYKKAQSAEFLIVSYELDKNSLPVFILESTGGEFKAKPIGTKEYWSQQIPATYIGQYATCEYEVFSKSGIPQKPIFISTRKLDASGNPLE